MRFAVTDSAAHEQNTAHRPGGLFPQRLYCQNIKFYERLSGIHHASVVNPALRRGSSWDRASSSFNQALRGGDALRFWPMPRFPGVWHLHASWR